ncbi:MAG: hypothetical protein R6V04_15070 [bacterium]
MFRKIIIICIIGIILHPLNLFSATKFGSKGLIYVHSARVLPKGYLEFLGGTRYFGKVASLASKQSAFTLWNVQGFTSFNYGLNSNVELAISPIIYQDTNNNQGNALDGQANVPDNLLVNLKVGCLGAENSHFLFGGILQMKFPTAKAYNIIYEPYTAGNFEAGIMGVVSYFSNITFPDEAISVHTNLGYWNHYDMGEVLTGNPDDPRPTSISSELLFGMGARFPAGTFDFSSEINARYFLNKPPVTAYSREYVSYLTAGIYYKPYRWISFQIGIDVKLITEDDVSQYTPNTSLELPELEETPNYPDWRCLLGVKFSILPFSLYSTPKSEFQRDVRNKKQLFKRMLDEDQDTEQAEDEVEKLRSKRLRIEKELERIRKLLEQEEQKKKKKK